MSQFDLEYVNAIRSALKTLWNDLRKFLNEWPTRFGTPTRPDFGGTSESKVCQLELSWRQEPQSSGSQLMARCPQKR